MQVMKLSISGVLFNTLCDTVPLLSFALAIRYGATPDHEHILASLIERLQIPKSYTQFRSPELHLCQLKSAQKEWCVKVHSLGKAGWERKNNAPNGIKKNTIKKLSASITHAPL